MSRSEAARPSCEPKPAWQRLGRFLLLAVTCAIVGVSLLPLAARVVWAADLTSHFRLQYLAVLGVLLVPLALLRHRRWLLIAILATIVSAAPTAGYWVGSLAAPAEPAAQDRLTVMTANLGMSSHAPDALLEIVRNELPDVLVLTEFTPRGERSLAELDGLYAHRYKMARADPWGSALYSRHALESAGPLALGDTQAIEARVRLPGGKLVRVIGVHLRSPISRARAAARNRQLSQLAAHRTTIAEPLVVTGDFNITPYSPFMRDWLAQTRLHDARRGFGFDVTWPAALPLLRIPIDHCIVSDHFRVRNHRRLPAFGSDHFPVLAELELP